MNTEHDLQSALWSCKRLDLWRLGSVGEHARTGRGYGAICPILQSPSPWSRTVSALELISYTRRVCLYFSSPEAITSLSRTIAQYGFKYLTSPLASRNPPHRNQAPRQAPSARRQHECTLAGVLRKTTLTKGYRHCSSRAQFAPRSWVLWKGGDEIGTILRFCIQSVPIGLGGTVVP
jgi:hypothetical protein